MNLKGLHLGEKMKYSHGINHKAMFNNFRI